MITDEKIKHFLEQQTCATICCTDQSSAPYCFNCFYATNFHDGLLYYKSSLNTHHSKLITDNPIIAGTVLPNKLSKLSIKGIQFTGTTLAFNHYLNKLSAAHYYKKHPLAFSVPGEIWTVQINQIKLTDSSLGFGKKIIWERNDAL